MKKSNRRPHVILFRTAYSLEWRKSRTYSNKEAATRSGPRPAYRDYFETEVCRADRAERRLKELNGENA